MEFFQPDQNQNQMTSGVVSQFTTAKQKRIPPWLIVAIIAVVVLGTILVVWLVNRSKSTPTFKVAAKVEITTSGFSPLTIHVKKGERVTWVNKDEKPHQVASDPHPTGDLLPSLMSEEPLLQDEQYTAIFEKAGTFTYHDYLDPVGYRATVIVE